MVTEESVKWGEYRGGGVFLASMERSSWLVVARFC